MARIDVVFDVPSIVKGASQLGPGVVLFPATPPKTGATYADALGVFSFPDDYFALILSTEILEAVAVVLVSELEWSFDEVSEFLELLEDVAVASGGGLARADHRATFVGLVVEETVSAARVAAATNLSPQRLLVTEDQSALRLGSLVPRGVQFNPSHDIAVESPEDFVETASRTRQSMRHI